MHDPKITITDDGKVMIMKTVYPNGIVTTDWCAIGRSTTWKSEPNPFAGINEACASASDSQRSGIDYFGIAVDLMKGTQL